MSLKSVLSVSSIALASFVFAACSPQQDVNEQAAVAPNGDTTAEQQMDAGMEGDMAADAGMEDDSMMAEGEMDAEASGNIVEVAQAQGNFSTLIQAAQAAGLAEALATQEVTVFAPTDAAFEQLPEGTLQELLNNPEQLAEILRYHVVSGTVTANQVMQLESAETLQGSSVDISQTEEGVMVDNATVVQTDVQASNGVIHVIDTVLMPDSMQQ